MALILTGRARIGLIAAVLALPALAFGLHGLTGNANANDDIEALGQQVLEASLSARNEASADESAAHLYEQLGRQLQRRPSDARALVLKARLDMSAGRYEDAGAGFEKALAGSSKVARDAGVWAEFAEARGMVLGRTLVGEPVRHIDKALSLDASHPHALDLAGSAAWEMRDFAAAAGHWTRLLAQLPPGTPRHVELSAAIERAQQRAKLALPAAR